MDHTTIRGSEHQPWEPKSWRPWEGNSRSEREHWGTKSWQRWEPHMGGGPMKDRLTKERRCWNMSRIKGKNTRPEIIVRSILYRMGYRFRLHVKNLPGRPDIVLPKYKTAIFVAEQIPHCMRPSSKTSWKHGHYECRMERRGARRGGRSISPNVRTAKT
jgi:DNA mismatch endonuclease Vsr